MAKVKAIREYGFADVYNMEVENVHNYAVNGGLIFHNCDALRYFCAGRPTPTVIKDTTPKHYDFEIFKPHHDPLGRGAKVRVI